MLIVVLDYSKNIYSLAQPVIEDVLGTDAAKTGNKYIKQG